MCGVNDERIQRRLLAEREVKLDFKRALELVQSMELAEKNSRELQSCPGARSPPQSQRDVRRVWGWGRAVTQDARWSGEACGVSCQEP